MKANNSPIEAAESVEVRLRESTTFLKANVALMHGESAAALRVDKEYQAFLCKANVSLMPGTYHQWKGWRVDKDCF